MEATDITFCTIAVGGKTVIFETHGSFTLHVVAPGDDRAEEEKPPIGFAPDGTSDSRR